MFARRSGVETVPWGEREKRGGTPRKKGGLSSRRGKKGGFVPAQSVSLREGPSGWSATPRTHPELLPGEKDVIGSRSSGEGAEAIATNLVVQERRGGEDWEGGEGVMSSKNRKGGQTYRERRGSDPSGGGGGDESHPAAKVKLKA